MRENLSSEDGKQRQHNGGGVSGGRRTERHNATAPRVHIGASRVSYAFHPF